MVMGKMITLDELNLLAGGAPPQLVRKEWETCAHILPTIAHFAAMAYIILRHNNDEWLTFPENTPSNDDFGKRFEVTEISGITNKPQVVFRKWYEESDWSETRVIAFRIMPEPYNKELK